jgi:hypothetical protein
MRTSDTLATQSSYEASGSLPPGMMAHPSFASGQLCAILTVTASGIMTLLTGGSQFLSLTDRNNGDPAR